MHFVGDYEDFDVYFALGRSRTATRDIPDTNFTFLLWFVLVSSSIFAMHTYLWIQFSLGRFSNELPKSNRFLNRVLN